MPSRPILVLAVAALLAVSGCLGGSAAPPSSIETRSVTTPATATATTATASTARPCSLAASNATLVVEPPANLSATTAQRVAETVESRYQSARVEEHSYFDHHTNVTRPEEVEGGYRVVLGGELDYDYRGNENGTVVHVHRPYTVVYLVTGREVVRRGEAGTTGTVVCWSSDR